MRAQVLLAAALPWLVGVLLRPDSPWWGVAVLLVVAVFAVLHRDLRHVWVLAASAVAGVGALVLDPVPTWYVIAAGAAALAAALVVLRGLRSGAAAATPRAAATIGLALVVTGVLTAALGLLANRVSDAQFDEGQSDMAAEFDSASAGPIESRPAPLTGGEEGATSPLIGPVNSSTDGASTPAPSAPAPSVRPPLARLEFRRPGSSDPPVTSAPLYVGPDVTAQGLAAGPGHYPQTVLPGRRGNMAIAGHRTGWGSPFLHLDDLITGDEVLLTTPSGEAYTYVVDLVATVEPDSPWVLEADPLGTGPRTLTLTTCDPPGSADRRLVVFATLVANDPG